MAPTSCRSIRLSSVGKRSSILGSSPFLPMFWSMSTPRAAGLTEAVGPVSELADVDLVSPPAPTWPLIRGLMTRA
eukprot:8005567-Alexandrium_andersonii.AAC.1